MAARWGTGEEILTPCNMDFFATSSLDEATCLTPSESLDPSILCMFEDAPAGEVRGLDEESEATLLTALTEILDNVDDENLSPFDILPDSELLSSQKGREHSPLRRLLCLSRSPEKDTIFSTRSLTGKSLPRTPAGAFQESNGVEEGSVILSAVNQPPTQEKELDWADLSLPLPLALEQEGEDGDCGSVSLGDLVRHMHPYCMVVSVEEGGEEHMLPEGGILLEVVDQGEDGEPILAIPDMGLPLPIPQDASPTVPALPEEAPSESEHIVVDDEVEDTASLTESQVSNMTPAPTAEVKDKMVNKRPKEEIMEKSPPRRKKKSKKEEPLPEGVEGRVLRSTSARRSALESPLKLNKEKVKQTKKSKVLSFPPAPSPVPFPQKNKGLLAIQAEKHLKPTTLTLTAELRSKVVAPMDNCSSLVKVCTEKSQSVCTPTVVNCTQLVETTELPAPEKLEVSPTATSAPLPVLQTPPRVSAQSHDKPTTSVIPGTSDRETPLSKVPAASDPKPAEVVPQPAVEPKPRPLSLAEYRRLRQQKKPTPLEREEDHSTKWPSLPELPKELPPIPCLPNPNPKDGRRPHPPTAKEEIEVKTAWHPIGPGAPPTPEALLVPPAYMVAASTATKAATATPAPKPSSPEPAKSTQPHSIASSGPAKKSPCPAPRLHDAPKSPQTSVTVSSPPAAQQVPTPETHTTPAEKAGVLAQPHPHSVPLIPVVISQVPSETTTIPPKTTPIAAVSVPMATCVPPKTTSTVQKVLGQPAPDSEPLHFSKATVPSSQPSPSEAARPQIPPWTPKARPLVVGAQMTLEAPRTKSPTQELIEAFTSEIGIEAADLTSLLEQFEETQAKEEKCVSEVCGQAAAVGNSSVEPSPEKTDVERVKAHDLSSTAALTPPATPPHQMWKPLAPVALLRKNPGSKPSPSKVIQIEPRPLPSGKLRSKPVTNVSAAVACMDHDYCLTTKDAAHGEQGKRWNVKQQASITIKTIQGPASITTAKPSPSAPATSHQAVPDVVTKTQEAVLSKSPDYRTEGMTSRSSILETPDASPTRQESAGSPVEGSKGRGPSGRSYRQRTSSRSPSPEEDRRGRSVRRQRSQRSLSPASGQSRSGSSSRSRSPPKKRYRPRHSRSSSSSSSRSLSCSSHSRSPPRRRRYSYSSSHSGSWSRSRSRSSSPRCQTRWGSGGRFYSPSYRPSRYTVRETPEEIKWRKEKAIEERRVVYVGRIRSTMTRKELKERFSLYGEIEECTLHFREHGDNYGFVTYYDTKDAFSAIENGSKLRNPDELPFDLCFGGRRQFCQSTYSDLDSNKEFDPMPGKGKFHALDFDTLLKQAQKNLKR